MDAMTVLSNGTMKAFALIAQRNGEGDSINIERAIDAMKGVLKSHLDDIINEWGDAVNANISPAWLATMVNAQANQYALEAWNAYKAVAA
jgi:hypothetical protein